MRGDQPTSPWVWSADDYTGAVLSISVPFDTTTLALQGPISVHRDAGCLWARVVWGDPNGVTQTSPSAPFGDSSLTLKQFQRATGFTTYTDLTDVQITAEP